MLAGVRPIGEHTIEEFEAAGGCRALMKQLEPLLDTRRAHRHRPHASRDNLATAPRRRRGSDPPDRATRWRADPAIVLLRGNLAPESGLIKTGIVERKVRRFTGPAICFWTSRRRDRGAASDGDIRPGPRAS